MKDNCRFTITELKINKKELKELHLPIKARKGLHKVAQRELTLSTFPIHG
jgi:hypothetical protein